MTRPRRRPSCPPVRPAPFRRRPAPLAEFLRTEAGGGALLLAATMVALVWANSP